MFFEPCLKIPSRVNKYSCRMRGFMRKRLRILLARQICGIWRDLMGEL